MTDWIDRPPRPILILDDPASGRARCCNCYATTHITARTCHWTELADGCGIIFKQITSPSNNVAACRDWRDDLEYVTLEWA